VIAWPLGSAGVEPKMHPSRLQLNRFRPKTRAEWLVIGVTVAVLIALIFSRPRWASSGKMNLQVQVVVFDAATGLPMEDAVVAIVRAPPAHGEYPLDAYRERFAPALRQMTEGRIGSRTAADGSSTIDFEFPTGSSHVHPESKAHVDWYWVLAFAEGYGEVAVPLRYESIETRLFAEQQVLRASVGLARPAVERK